MRSAQQVFDSHLKLRLENDVEKDIEENYSPDISIISNHGVFRGHEGVRESAETLSSKLPEAEFTYKDKIVEGEVAYLVWEGKSPKQKAIGTDTFIIKNGKIELQTIFYEITQ